MGCEVRWDEVAVAVFVDTDHWPCTTVDGRDPSLDNEKCFLCETRKKVNCHFETESEVWDLVSKTWFFEYLRAREARRG